MYDLSQFWGEMTIEEKLKAMGMLWEMICRVFQIFFTFLAWKCFEKKRTEN